MKIKAICPECGKEIEVDYTPERKTGIKRGQLAGIALKDMTNEQLKIEIINASSVLSKAKARNASADVIAAAEDRVAAAKAERKARKAGAENKEAETEKNSVDSKEAENKEAENKEAENKEAENKEAETEKNSVDAKDSKSKKHKKDSVYKADETL